MRSAENSFLPVENPGEADTIAWLGDPPSRETINLLPSAGYTRGTYRMWCKPPSKVTKVLVYRHPLGPVVVGIELFGPSNHDAAPESVLLGFRTLWMEAAITYEIDEGAQLIGFAVKERQEQDHGSRFLALEDVKVGSEIPILCP